MRGNSEHITLCFRRVWPPFLLQLWGIPLLIYCFSSHIKKMNTYVPPLTKTKPNQNQKNPQSKLKPQLKRRPWSCSTQVWAIALCDCPGRAGAGEGSPACCQVQETGANSTPKALPGAGPWAPTLIPPVLSLQSLGISAGRTGSFITLL